jgi:hypothetical protein
MTPLPLIVSSFRRTVSVGLVIVRAIVIIVPSIVSFVLDAVSLLAPVFNPIACISVAYNVAQVSVVPILTALLRGSDDVG